MSREETIVREVLAMWANGSDGAQDSWRRHGANGLIWWNSARGAVEGLDACVAAIDEMHAALGIDHVKAPIRRITADGGCVFVERSDDLYRSDETLIQAISVVGVVEFDGEKIVSWRDYADDWLLKMSQNPA
jgi:limonene-1,2-epoxide hydrolase